MVAAKTIRVLVLDDNPGDVGIIRQALAEYSGAEFFVDSALSAKRGRKRLAERSWDILLLDYSLPGESGLEFLRSISEFGDNPPVIMLTGQGDEKVAKEAIRIGASDYFPKDSIQANSLGTAIEEALEKARLDAEQKQVHAENQRMAYLDSLTGLYNRRYLDEALTSECSRARRYWTAMSVIMIDLDGFKECNDAFGHLAGDQVLREVAGVIKASVRDIDVPARFGGDEFCILLPETAFDGAMLLAERLRFAIASLHMIAGMKGASITASIGVFTPQARNQMHPEPVMQHADAALRHAKLAGKNQVRAWMAASATVA